MLHAGGNEYAAKLVLHLKDHGGSDVKEERDVHIWVTGGSKSGTNMR